MAGGPTGLLAAHLVRPLLLRQQNGYPAGAELLTYQIASSSQVPIRHYGN